MTDKADPPNPWTIKSSRITYENPWMRIREDKVITPTGKDGIYGVLESNDSVMTIALNDKKEIYLIRKFRYPEQTWNCELPGGGTDKQDPINAGMRELEEETGIIAQSWQEIGKTTICNGFMTQKMHTLLAEHIEFKGSKEISDEIIEQSGFFTITDIEAMILSGKINDNENITALTLYRLWRDKKNIRGW